MKCPYCQCPYPEGRSICLNLKCWVDWNAEEKQALWGIDRAEADRVSVRLSGIQHVAEEMSHYAIVHQEQFESVCAKFGVDPEDDALVDHLVTVGWTFAPGFGHQEDEYISPDKPEGRRRMLVEGWLGP